MKALIFFLSLLGSLFSHDLLHTVSQKEAVVITLTYPDGAPFSYEPYTLYAPASDTVPFQKGVTAQNGTLAFSPDTPGTWTIKAASADGHGAVITYEAAPGKATADGTSGMPYWQRLLTGVALIFGFFGLFVLFKPKKGNNS